MTSPPMASPIPLSDIEAVLAWVDTFKLSKPTKKINRDFSDAVLLAEILAVHYPKLVEMHNYPPRNSHSLKLNNWMTLNRKVLKRLKLNLCTTTMEQLANSAPGIIERVLIMVRDKIKRDEELEKSTREPENNISSGGSYYEACGDDEGVLVVPLKTRVNGVLETIQQKVVSYELYISLKEELKDAKDTTNILRQKMEHLDSLIKLKDERINELQKQLERKQSRRREMEMLQNTINAPFEEPPKPVLADLIDIGNKKPSVVRIPVRADDETKSIEEPKNVLTPKVSVTKLNYNDIQAPSITDVVSTCFEQNKILDPEVERIRSDVFKEATDDEMYNETDNCVTIESTIMRELGAITWPEKVKTENP